ncbi:hypothetical protein HZA97_08090 [Candidatus Woesearchaeota archaeon]|nr:hypothetical protein [Candidatus Woesearchaeota archaeon]
MSKPPKFIQVELNEKDVRENLVSILNGMQRIRQESITNLGATDEQKTDYLRLTGELAGCVKTLIKENNLQKQFEEITKSVENNLLLRSYDLLQEKFWQEQNPEFKQKLEGTTAALLGEDFVSLTQAYHLFQALKLASAKESERADVFYTILPFNTLVNSIMLSQPEVASYLLNQLFSNVKSDGVGIEGNVTREAFINAAKNAGVLYIDLPANQYETLRKEFPKTRLVQEKNKKVARIIFDQTTEEQGTNTLTELRKYATKHLGKVEDDLGRRISNFYSYGKEFRKTMLEEMTGRSELEEVVEEKKFKKGKKKQKKSAKSKLTSILTEQNANNRRVKYDQDPYRVSDFDPYYGMAGSSWGDAK